MHPGVIVDVNQLIELQFKITTDVLVLFIFNINVKSTSLGGGNV